MPAAYGGTAARTRLRAAMYATARCCNEMRSAPRRGASRRRSACTRAVRSSASRPSRGGHRRSRWRYSAAMIRVSAKAVIVRDDKLLVIAHRDADGEYFLLPGGGQERFESLHDALRRECR